MRLVVAVTGSSGVIYGVRFLRACADLGIETDLVVSRAAETILRLEMGMNAGDLKRIATRSYEPDELTAPISSGSCPVDGMVIVPCSMKTMGAIANGITSDLISRAADVMLKSGRPLVLVPRETPLNLIHIENMLRLKRAGATVLPASPAFYHGPKTVEDLVDYIAGRILEVLGVKHTLYRPWGGI
jgi:4-hydroxy-3-polyprenylbenzoate decarboxylase